ncbi:MAG: DUF1854 domain-containing protein [Aquabacterium sp.]|jgi:hypothetical protein|uniref:cyanophycin metabolism-associated DUF1854 family protein n=1 Tax=Aquabacterium sp. TaxID=1872578 RepID=UPI002A371923|nr:DUF1854 domain-containing protein [Aquabacterium sp.]MDX9843761.1 DUF1854 domain-containing protein [Aquabacterium sp.]
MRDLTRNDLGQLTLTLDDGSTHVGIVPVRAYPLSAPDEGLSLMNTDGHEVLWIDRLSALPTAWRQLLEAELAVRELTPQVTALLEVSSFSTPSTWTVDTDRGRTSFVLKSEDDIRRLGDGRLLIHSAQGLNFGIADRTCLDKHSRKLLERFL